MEVNNVTNNNIFESNSTATTNTTSISNTTDVLAEENSNDTQIVRETLRVYGSLYFVIVVSFSLLRRRYPKLFNIRSWVEEFVCDISLNTSRRNESTNSGYWIFSWIWEVFQVPDDDILDQCGMDALCFIRVLRFGRKISMFGCFHAIWLLPLYGTAPDSDETSYLTDPLVKMSAANLPSDSPRFLGTVLAGYMIYIYTMHLILHEFEWYTSYRHKFLMQRKPRNYAIYVSGIPEAYQSSFALLDYFRQCASQDSAVVEAYVARDLPKLEQKIARRQALVDMLEHAYAFEQKMGEQYTCRKLTKTGVAKVETVETYEAELNELNNDVETSIKKIWNMDCRLRSQLRKSMAQPLLGTMSLEHEEQHHNRDQECMETSDDSVTEENFTLIDKAGHHDAADSLHRVFSDGSSIVDIQTNGSSSDGITITSSDSDLRDNDMHKHKKISDVLPNACSVKQDSISIHQKNKAKSSYNMNGGEQNNHFDGNVVRDVQQEDKLKSDISSPTATTATCESDCSVPANQTIGGAFRKQVLNAGGIIGGTVKKQVMAATDIIPDAVSKQIVIVGGYGAQNIQKNGVASVKKATEFGTNIVGSAAAIVPLNNFGNLLNGGEDGKPREAGFVVFSDLYTTHAALQMIHHPTPYVMEVTEAPDPDDIFWRNVGLPANAKRTGRILSTIATAVLCFFWSIPVAFISSLTEVSSIKKILPFLEDFIDNNGWVEMLLAQAAPIMLLILQDVVLPGILTSFATWEGHVATPALEASLFIKLAMFMLIQTFFVSAISGGISAELSNMLNDPGSIVDLLANSLPAQSTYFLQLLLVNVFLVQGLDLLRVSLLVKAFLRGRFIGPNLTKKERSTPWKGIHPLENPPEFSHSSVLAPLLLFSMVYFVYSTIAPIINFFLALCFFILEKCYRYQFFHNYPPTSSDSGGKLWKGYIRISLVCMMTAQVTLIGLLILKKSIYAVPFMGPMIAGSTMFIFYINIKHFYVTNHLPTRECVEMDNRNKGNKHNKYAVVSGNDDDENGDDFSFVKGKYIQPCLQTPMLHPERAAVSDV